MFRTSTQHCSVVVIAPLPCFKTVVCKTIYALTMQSCPARQTQTTLTNSIHNLVGDCLFIVKEYYQRPTKKRYRVLQTKKRYANEANKHEILYGYHRSAIQYASSGHPSLNSDSHTRHIQFQIPLLVHLLPTPHTVFCRSKQTGTHKLSHISRLCYSYFNSWCAVRLDPFRRKLNTREAISTPNQYSHPLPTQDSKLFPKSHEQFFIICLL